MSFHDFKIINIETARFTQYGIINRHLAQIVHRGCSDQNIEEFIRQISAHRPHFRHENFHNFACALDMPFHVSCTAFGHLRHTDNPFLLYREFFAFGLLHVLLQQGIVASQGIDILLFLRIIFYSEQENIFPMTCLKTFTSHL